MADAISILIPTHDYKCYRLVADLQKQFAAMGGVYEILVAEDGSRDQVSIIHNHRINELPGCRHIILRDNMGRAAIKNMLAREAEGEWLLYIDSDAVVDTPNFARNLMEALKTHSDAHAICGGMHHVSTLPRPDVSLRWTYEHTADTHRSAAERSIHPYQHMTPFNLCVRHEVMLDMPFDERCTDYGYEDALFGVTLKEKGMKVVHIDNPLLHAGLESNEVFLRKVETALQTLHKLGGEMMRESHVGCLAIKLRAWHVGTAVYTLCACLYPLMRNNLLGNRPSLRVLALYKLGYLLGLMRKG